MRMTSIVIDCDGVLADFESYFCWKFGWEKRDRVQLDKRYPKERKNIEKFIKSKYTYKSLAPIQLGLDVVRFLHDKGHDIDIITSRPHGTFDVTYDWIKRYNIPFTNIHIASSNKEDKIKAVQPIFAIDDVPSIAEACRTFNVPCILMAHPWNIDDTASPRFETLQEFEFIYNRLTNPKLHKKR
jgi:phosphoglycolate phosphatase-like HAD superfamily hydrolase